MSPTPASAQPADKDGPAEAECASLLALPVDLLQVVLGMADGYDPKRLLCVSKVMAQQVMQHKSGKLELKVHVGRGSVNVAAIRQLLLCAPSTCLKLTLGGWRGIGLASAWKASSMFDTPVPGQALHQYPSVSEVHLFGFLLPGLVPASLAAACPNLHTVHISNCTINDSVECNSSSSSVQADASAMPTDIVTDTRIHQPTSSSISCPSNSSNDTAGRPAMQLRTLTLTSISAPQLHCLLPAPSGRSTTKSSQEYGYVIWLRSTVSSVSCLRMHKGRGLYGDAVHFIALLPRLKELYVSELKSLSDPLRPELAGSLQQLQKLVLPQCEVASSDDMELLLSLPSLTHVELGTVRKLTVDYSSHPCRWQYLKLHLPRWSPLCLNSLSKLPLQQLQQPVALGSAPYIPVVVQPSGTDGLAALPDILNKLIKPGVQLLASGVIWKADGDDVVQGAKIAPAVILAGSVFGNITQTGLSAVVLDHGIMQALATLYQNCIQKLSLHDVTFSADMLPTWHATLLAWHTLTEIDLYGGWPAEKVYRAARAVRCLAAAMAKQPAGRCIKLMVREDPCCGSAKLSELILRDAEQQLVGVRVSVEECNSDPFLEWRDTSFRFTAGHDPSHLTAAGL